MFKLIIRTPYDKVFEGDAKSVYLSSEGGDLQCFENHASLSASIQFSPVVVEEEGKDETYLARNGSFFFDNDKNEAILLVSSCEKKSEISYQSVEDYAKFIEEQLEKGEDLSEFQILFLKNEKVAVEKQIEEIK